MPRFSVPFVLNYFEYVLVEEFLEILSRYTDVNIVVYLNGNAYSIAFSNAKATRKNNLVFKMIFGDGAFKKLHYLLRSFKMAGRAYADLYE